LEIVL